MSDEQTGEPFDADVAAGGQRPMPDAPRDAAAGSRRTVPPTTISLLGRRVRVGTLAIAAALAIACVCGALGGRDPRLAALGEVALAGFAGGLAVALAHRLPYTSMPFVPGSGALLERRAGLEAAVADAVAARLTDREAAAPIVRQVADRVEPEAAAQMANAVLDALRPELVAFLGAPAQRARLRAMIEQRGGRLGGMADALGVVSYDAVVGRIVDALVAEVRTLTIQPAQVAEALERLGPLDALVLQPGHPRLVGLTGPDRALLDVAAERLDVSRRIRELLARPTDAEVAALLARRVGEPATWLEVFGVAVGAAVWAVGLAVGAVLG
jgi:hypothetical protein